MKQIHKSKKNAPLWLVISNYVKNNMCGITGYFCLTSVQQNNMLLNHALTNATARLTLRGPDQNGKFSDKNIGLGHARLSIIDTSQAGKQPMTDASGRYTIVFNGEFFNYQTYRNELLNDGVPLQSTSDTEVALYLFIKYGKDFVHKINGFFALAIYDNATEQLFIYRDRFGIKPLLYYFDENTFYFASEMKALLAYPIPREIDQTALFTYFQLNYIPYPKSIFKGVHKLAPGHYLVASKKGIDIHKYYDIAYTENIQSSITYLQAQEKLRKLMYDAVKMRLMADVPLGSFLSGGIDSSVVTAIAAETTPHLNTFSIGYKDEPFFDETRYAELVANKFQTNHTVFSLTNTDLLEHFEQALDYLDEPFADSSALAVYILSKHTRKKVTVALSGDGADELFAGYNKHYAEYRLRKLKMPQILGLLSPFFNALPASRNGAFSNKVRQIQKLTKGSQLSAQNRYWQWCAYTTEQEAKRLLNFNQLPEDYPSFKSSYTNLVNGHDFQSVLNADMHLVLPNDMLYKVDMMSMANSLEVRPPFLDYRIVEFAFATPTAFKIDKTGKKKIVKDAFKHLLPKELYNRPKHGFEVPLQKWFNNELKQRIDNEWLKKDFLLAQNIFNYNAIQQLKRQLYSQNPGDSVARMWAIIAFQHWWEKWYKS